jgi:hypothetical protein
MLGQLRNEIGKRAVASSCDAAADEELVAAAKKGDELGFESLAKRHQRRIFADRHSGMSLSQVAKKQCCLTSGLPTTRPESPDQLHTDASCLSGIITIGCEVGREFTAERETQNNGDPLTIRLSMRGDSKSLTTFFRDQGTYLSIALVIGATFWALGQLINPFTVILYSLCLGNFLSPPMRWLSFLYEKPFPYDWVIFLTVLCVLSVPVYVLSSVIVWWFAPPMPHSLGHMIATGWKLPILVIVVFGVMNFLYEKTKGRLERRNVELQSMVQAGAARMEIQNEELQRGGDFISVRKRSLGRRLEVNYGDPAA